MNDDREFLDDEQQLRCGCLLHGGIDHSEVTGCPIRQINKMNDHIVELNKYIIENQKRARMVSEIFDELVDNQPSILVFSEDD
jgi:hypothetical protein